jgi:formylglycine-generating enzyme required for sulfatase activity
VLSDGTTLDEHAWYCGNADETPHPVGLLEANGAGLHDVAGNVWEYAHDWYAPYPAGPVTDPWGPASGDQRLKRGGPWKKHPVDQRLAERFEYDPALFFNTMGFRVARSAAATD